MRRVAAFDRAKAKALITWFNVQAATTAKSRYQCLHQQVTRVLQRLNDHKYSQVRCRHNAFCELRLQNRSRHPDIQTLPCAAIGEAAQSPRQARPVMGGLDGVACADAGLDGSGLDAATCADAVWPDAA